MTMPLAYTSCHSNRTMAAILQKHQAVMELIGHGANGNVMINIHHVPSFRYGI